MTIQPGVGLASCVAFAPAGADCAAAIEVESAHAIPSSRSAGTGNARRRIKDLKIFISGCSSLFGRVFLFAVFGEACKMSAVVCLSARKRGDRGIERAKS